MDYKDLEKKNINLIENNFFTKGISNLNQISGLEKNDQFALGLFLKLGILFRFERVNDPVTVPKLDTEEDRVTFLLSQMNAYVMFEDKITNRETAVNIVYKYHDEEDMNRIVNLLREEAAIVFSLFVYLHEVQHILRRHNTTTFQDIMRRTATIETGKDYKELELHQLANIAEDHCINYSLMEIFEKTPFSEFCPIIKKNALYDDKYRTPQMNEQDVLKDLLKNEPQMKVLSVSKDGASMEIEVTDKDGNTKKISVNINQDPNGDKKDGKGGTPDEMADSMAQAIQQHIDQQRSKGDESFRLGEMIEKSIKVEVLWFDKLKNSMYNLVNRKTKDFTVDWSNLNPKFRHIYKSPVKRNIERQLNIVLSIDQSGSMSMESLRKLLYIIEQKAKKINTITVLAHDVEILSVMENETNEKAIVDTVKKRHGGGGTSHKYVFEWLDENIKKNDLHRMIYISFSDNYSDIEEEYRNHYAIQKIDKVWLNCQGRDVDVPGMKVEIS